MKRISALFLACLMAFALAGCAGSAPQPPEPTAAPAPSAAPAQSPSPALPTPSPEPTPEPTPAPTPEPPTEPATVLVSGAGVIGKLFSLGEEVDVTAAQDGYYLVESEYGPLYVERWLVRMADEEQPQPFTAYAKGDTRVYRDPYLETELLATLGLNMQFTVEDSFGPLMRVQLADGTEGYTLASGVSRTPIYYEQGGGAAGGQDGGDITIASRGQRDAGIVLLTARSGSGELPFVSGKGLIRAEGAEGYLALYDRGDELRVLERGDEWCSILLDGQTGTMLTALLAFADGAGYEPWDGYAMAGAPFHSHYRMLDESMALQLNEAVHVVGEYRNVYLVEVGGSFGVVPMDRVSRTPIVYNYDGGGGGGDSSGGWTEPVL
ncbi:MAG: hypothetical protein IK095_02710 [Oscillospiraceae bacterium]|nr:hypothetical protein [Oscillospiraceae bacterium]